MMYLKKLASYTLIMFVLLVAPAISQENLAIAGEKPEIFFPHKLYVIEMSGTLTVQWTGSSPPYALRAYYPLLNKYYPFTEDIDGDPNNREWAFKMPRTGIAFIEIQGVSPTSIWVSGKDTKIPDEPIGWYLFVRPSAPTGGGIDSTPESFREDL